jgi:hypothetical protein
MENKTATKKLDSTVVIAIIALASAILGAFINGIFGNGVLVNKIFATETPTITPSAIISAPYLELTAMANETKSAEQRATAIALLTQAAGATSTQQYISVLQTAKADLEVTRIVGQAQQQLATEQALNAEATAQSYISTQQAATAIVNEQSSGQILSFVDKLPDLPDSFFDTFDDNKNGWSPKNGNGYSVAVNDGLLKVNFSNPDYSPFIWTCDNCGSFNNFSYQIDIKTPTGTSRIIAGILFGSPTRIDQQPFQESYALSIYSNGAILLERISLTSRYTVQLWDNRQDLINSDGKFHTLQVVAIDKNAAIYVDGKPVGDVLKLDYSTAGYIGVVSQSTGIDVVFDNLKVVLMP